MNPVIPLFSQIHCGKMKKRKKRKGIAYLSSICENCSKFANAARLSRLHVFVRSDYPEHAKYTPKCFQPFWAFKDMEKTVGARLFFKWETLSGGTSMLLFPAGNRPKLWQWSASEPHIELSPTDQLIVCGHKLLEAPLAESPRLELPSPELPALPSPAF